MGNELLEQVSSLELEKAIYEPTFSFPGLHLIEASAGTGKTFSIQTLYLRLVVEKGIPVQQILVLTFTKAAAHELRDRLRKILERARDFLMRPPSTTGVKDAEEDRLSKILALPVSSFSGGKEEIQCTRIERALLDFDEAAIHTIHGFCQQILRRQAVALGQTFDTEVVGEEDRVFEEMFSDWWRRHAYAVDPVVPGRSERGDWAFSFPHSAVISFAELKDLAQRLIQKPHLQLRPPPTSEAFSNLAAAIAQFFDAFDRRKMGDLLAQNKMKPKREEQEALDSLQKLKDAGKISPLFWKSLKDLAQAKLKKNASNEARNFCEQCQRILALRLATIHRLADRVAKEIQEKKASSLQLTYDDLVLHLYRAILDSQKGEEACRILRRLYRALLVDEFQDTDPFQYEIFRRVWIADPSIPVFLVGDPKQAIYSFRQGDIFTYFTARESCPPSARYSLRVNYRSEPLLVEAINRIFKDRFSSESSPYLLPFEGNIEGRGPVGKEPLRIALTTPSTLSHAAEGDKKEGGLFDTPPLGVDPQPFKIWYYDLEFSQSRSLSVQHPSYRAILRDMAQEIRSLLDTPSTHLRLQGRGIRPADIAILVTRHKEAIAIQRELARFGIRAIRQSSESVFESREAADLLLVLDALAHPTDRQKVATALATDLFPISDAELGGLPTLDENPNLASPSKVEEWMAIFQKAHTAWRESSVMKAFFLLDEAFQIRASLCALEDGERRIANFLHLLELLHRHAIEQKRGPHETLRWLQHQCEAATRTRDEDFEERLASDENAVRILTIFKSKGLEFPIVFIPTLGFKKPKRRSKRELCLYHERDNANQEWKLILDSTHDEEAWKKFQREQEEEDRRLFYVAATRAVHRCYVIWGSFHDPQKDQSPLSAVFCHRKSNGDQTALTIDTQNPLSPILFDPPAPIAFESRTISESTENRHFSSRRLFPSLDPSRSSSLQIWSPPSGRPIQVNKSRSHTSFSALVHASDAPLTVRDRDAFDFSLSTFKRQGPVAVDLFTLEGGPRIGTAWHAIMEEIDFTAFQPGAVRECRAKEEQKIARLLREGRWHPVVTDFEPLFPLILTMVESVLSAELVPEKGPPFRLYEISWHDRASEMDFDFALRSKEGGGGSRTTRRIYQVLERHWKEDPVKSAFVETLKDWNREIPQGFFTGYIDLVFRKEGRYFLVDWKTNRRSGRAEDFDAAGLAEEMAQQAYYLQYLFYTVALHQYLRDCLPSYRYSDHFGGVFYLFLRAIHPAVPRRGIFYDRPSLPLIEELSELLGDFRR